MTEDNKEKKLLDTATSFNETLSDNEELNQLLHTIISLPEDKQKITADLNAMQTEIENTSQELPLWEEKQRLEIERLREKMAKNLITKPIDELKLKYKKFKGAIDFLRNVQKNICYNRKTILYYEQSIHQEVFFD